MHMSARMLSAGLVSNLQNRELRDNPMLHACVLQKPPHAGNGCAGRGIHVRAIGSSTGDKPQLIAGIFGEQSRELSQQVFPLAVDSPTGALHAVRAMAVFISEAVVEANSVFHETALRKK